MFGSQRAFGFIVLAMGCSIASLCSSDSALAGKRKCPNCANNNASSNAAGKLHKVDSDNQTARSTNSPTKFNTLSNGSPTAGVSRPSGSRQGTVGVSLPSTGNAASSPANSGNQSSNRYVTSPSSTKSSTGSTGNGDSINSKPGSEKAATGRDDGSRGNKRQNDGGKKKQSAGNSFAAPYTPPQVQIPHTFTPPPPPPPPPSMGEMTAPRPPAPPPPRPGGM